MIVLVTMILHDFACFFLESTSRQRSFVSFLSIRGLGAVRDDFRASGCLATSRWIANVAGLWRWGKPSHGQDTSTSGSTCTTCDVRDWLCHWWCHRWVGKVKIRIGSIERAEATESLCRKRCALQWRWSRVLHSRSWHTAGIDGQGRWEDGCGW